MLQSLLHAPRHVAKGFLDTSSGRGYSQREGGVGAEVGEGASVQASQSSNAEKRETDMQRRSRESYFDPSVGSDWGSRKSICLAGISLAPGNPTGFLRIGGGWGGGVRRLAD